MSGFDPQRRRSIIGTSSRNSSPSNNGSVDAISSELKVGARAQVQGKIGQIRFVGTTSFQTGKWVGIELEEPQGKNSGVVQGKRYFECRINHGVFVRPSQVKVLLEEESDTEIIVSPSVSERARFAPAQDPNLAAARNIQQHLPSSSSSTLLPSRISSPSRISRLPLTPTGTKKATNFSRKSASPTASVTAAKKSKVVSPTRPRSNTNTQKEIKENKLTQLRLQQQERLALIQQQQQQQQEEQERLEQEEEEAELQRQLQEEEDMAAADAIASQQQQQYEDVDEQSYDTESNDTSSDRGVGLVSTNSSTNIVTTRVNQQSYGSLAANLPISKSDQMIPLKDYEELRLKLKILESKRQEDRERYREHEKVKEEAEQFLTLRNKLQGI